jgi:hypothetical protein
MCIRSTGSSALSLKRLSFIFSPNWIIIFTEPTTTFCLIVLSSVGKILLYYTVNPLNDTWGEKRWCFVTLNKVERKQWSSQRFTTVTSLQLLQLLLLRFAPCCSFIFFVVLFRIFQAASRGVFLKKKKRNNILLFISNRLLFFVSCSA